MKQNATCTGLLQQWHKPKGGKKYEKTSVNDMLGIEASTIEPDSDVTNYYFDLFSKGNEYGCAMVQVSKS